MSSLTLENDWLAVSINPNVGGTITTIRHKLTGLSVLGHVPWQTVDAPIASLAAHDELQWLTRYTGGWPLLFPNTGDACEVDGIFHGFHGEASIAPWDASSETGRLVLSRNFTCIPVTMHRTLWLEGEALHVSEELTYSGNGPAQVIWGHHPSFGSDLLNGPFEITCGAENVHAEANYDPPANPLIPGTRGHWPNMPGKDGSVDLAHPRRPCSSVAYLTHFRAPWAAIRREDDAIAALLTWDQHRFPCALLWCELDGTPEPPWSSRTRLIGIEPMTTPCGLGLGEAIRRRAHLLQLEPGLTLQASLSLHVFRPSGPILNGPAHLGINNSI